jgi:TolB-like protein
MEKPFPSYEGDAPYLFVSYDHKDTEDVYPEMTWIRTSGFNLWYDEGIHVGTVWREALADALSDCSGFIFFSTERSNASDNCRKEINYALDEGKQMFVVQLDGTPLPRLLRLSLSDRQALVRSEFDEPTYRARLVSALSTVVQPTPDMISRVSSDVPISLKADPPSIAVLPLVSQSDDSEMRELAESITDDVTGLTLQRSWRVVGGRASDLDLEPEEVGRQRNVRYLLSGSVRRQGPNIRVTIKLAETTHGNQVWVQRLDRPYEDFYKLQDSVIAGIVGALVSEVLYAEKDRFKDRPIDELDAHALLSLAWGKAVVDRKSRDELLALVYRAVEADPEYSLAHSVLSVVLSNLIVNAFSRDAEKDAIAAVDHADRGLFLAPNEAWALTHGSTVHRRHGNEALALRLAERATEMMGRPAGDHYAALIQLGRSEEAMQLAKEDPEPPQSILSLVALLTGRLDAAVESAQILVGDYPQGYLNWAALANALAMVDRLAEANDAVRRVQAIIPTWTLDLYEKGTRLGWRNREDVVEALVAGLRKLNIE